MFYNSNTANNHNGVGNTAFSNVVLKFNKMSLERTGPGFHSRSRTVENVADAHYCVFGVHLLATKNTLRIRLVFDSDPPAFIITWAVKGRTTQGYLWPIYKGQSCASRSRVVVQHTYIYTVKKRKTVSAF